MGANGSRKARQNGVTHSIMMPPSRCAYPNDSEQPTLERPLRAHLQDFFGLIDKVELSNATAHIAKLKKRKRSRRPEKRSDLSESDSTELKERVTNLENRNAKLAEDNRSQAEEIAELKADVDKLKERKKSTAIVGGILLAIEVIKYLAELAALI